MSLPEVVVVVAVIGILSLGIPAVTYVVQSAEEQRDMVNNAPDPLANMSFPSDLTYDENTRTFAFNEPPEPTPEPVSPPVDPGPEPILDPGLWSSLSVKANSGTATFGSDNNPDFWDVGMPGLMLQGNGSGSFKLHNNGQNGGPFEQYRGEGDSEYTEAGSWIDLEDFLSDLEMIDESERFDPPHTKILSLEKGDMRADLQLAHYVESNGTYRLRLTEVWLYDE